MINTDQAKQIIKDELERRNVVDQPNQLPGYDATVANVVDALEKHYGRAIMYAWGYALSISKWKRKCGGV